MGWKESKVGRKRRKKVDFDITLLEGKAKRGGIGQTPVRSRKKRGDKAIQSHITERAIRSHGTDTTNIVLIGSSQAKKLMKEFDSPAVLVHEKQMEKHVDVAHPILLMCQNCGLEGLQSEWVKRGESKQSKPKLTCPRCGSSEYKETE